MQIGLENIAVNGQLHSTGHAYFDFYQGENGLILNSESGQQLDPAPLFDALRPVLASKTPAAWDGPRLYLSVEMGLELADRYEHRSLRCLYFPLTNEQAAKILAVKPSF